MKKKIHFDKRAYKFIEKKMPKRVKEEFYALLNVLEKRGVLKYPDAKKIRGYNELFEIRVRTDGAWRGFYAYLTKEDVIVLHCFNKKTNKTPKKELEIAINRLNYYK